MNQKAHEHLNLLGQRFGQLEVIEELPYRINKFGKREYMWLCRCDCGGTIEECTHNLRTGSATRCKKCYNADGYGKIHGKSKTKLFHVWQQMKERCYNPDSHNYYLYGGRGIKMCEEWMDYATFDDWAHKNGYREEENHRKNCSIDRIDVNGDYSPDNCRFTDSKTQQQNRRNTRYHFYKGAYVTLKDVSEIENIPVPKLNTQIYGCGRTMEEAVERIKKNGS